MFGLIPRFLQLFLLPFVLSRKNELRAQDEQGILVK
jgi:hypothetical protein